MAAHELKQCLTKYISTAVYSYRNTEKVLKFVELNL
jgi:hypothetical protein